MKRHNTPPVKTIDHEVQSLDEMWGERARGKRPGQEGVATGVLPLPRGVKKNIRSPKVSQKLDESMSCRKNLGQEYIHLVWGGGGDKKERHEPWEGIGREKIKKSNAHKKNGVRGQLLEVQEFLKRRLEHLVHKTMVIGLAEKRT